MSKGTSRIWPLMSMPSPIGEAALEVIRKEESSWRLITTPMIYHALSRKEDSNNALAELIVPLASPTLERCTVVAVVGDHGQGLGQHARQFAG